jgi:tRNA 5-methylaminomethyl-2-thiouridine biosynthesis bifunctional protein
MNNETEKYRFASIDWSDPLNPRSKIFNDIYFSSSGGEGETIHTFLNGNNLGERLGELPPGSSFLIAETGFGTGSNLLILLEEYSSLIRSKGLKLTYLSFEKYPLHPDDMSKAHTNFACRSDVLPEFLEKYACSDFSRREIVFYLSDLAAVKIFLGDISSHLADFSVIFKKSINAWFLDGYSPSCNPDLWTDELFSTMKTTAAPDCTLATYTVSGTVRRGLAAAGFEIKKVPGFGRKKEMCRGWIKSS